MPHTPVLLQIVCEYLALRPGNSVIDATAGAGGYSRAFIGAVRSSGRVLMIDWDPRAVAALRSAFRAERTEGLCVLAEGNFKDLGRIAQREKFSAVQGVAFDFGTSRMTLQEFGQGFSFNQDEPLVMTYSPEIVETAYDVVNRYAEQELKRIFSELGEERFSGRIARCIVEERAKNPLTTTGQLADVIIRAVPVRGRTRLHPATRVFQALRIHVNRELENISAALPQALELLAPGGRIAAVSYHSLEDRIVKRTFRDFAQAGKGNLITRKPITPDRAEIVRNPSSRSAKLRVIEKI